MIVMKFGGTSVGSADAINNVLNIVANKSKVNENQEIIVVLSAVGGVTNLLVKLIDNLKDKIDKINEFDFIKKEIESNFYELILDDIESKHSNLINDLGILIKNKKLFDENINEYIDIFGINLNQYLNSKIKELKDICESILVIEEITKESENLYMNILKQII